MATRKKLVHLNIDSISKRWCGLTDLQPVTDINDLGPWKANRISWPSLWSSLLQIYPVIRTAAFLTILKVTRFLRTFEYPYGFHDAPPAVTPCRRRAQSTRARSPARGTPTYQIS